MTNPAFCSVSQLDSSSGDKMYAPAENFGSVQPLGQYEAIVKRTFTHGSYVAKGNTGIQFHLLKGIIIALHVCQHRFILTGVFYSQQCIVL